MSKIVTPGRIKIKSINDIVKYLYLFNSVN